MDELGDLDDLDLTVRPDQLRKLMAYETETLRASPRLSALFDEAAKRGSAAVFEYEAVLEAENAAERKALSDADELDEDDDISWDDLDSDEFDSDDLFEEDERYNELYSSVVADYASRVKQVLSSKQQQEWTDRLHGVTLPSWFDSSGAHAAVGAVSLYEELDTASLDYAFTKARVSIDTGQGPTCWCGNADGGIVTATLCSDCTYVGVERWKREEVRLLHYTPNLARDVAKTIADGSHAIARVLTVGGHSAQKLKDAELASLRKRLGRANRRNPAEFGPVDLTEWSKLAELLQRADSRRVRVTAKKAKRHLGMAQLAQLSLPNGERV